MRDEKTRTPTILRKSPTPGRDARIVSVLVFSSRNEAQRTDSVVNPCHCVCSGPYAPDAGLWPLKLQSREMHNEGHHVLDRSQGPLRNTVLAVALLAWLPISGGAASASVKSGIHRCIGEDDVKIFTDRACSALAGPGRRTCPTSSTQPALAAL